MLWRIFSWHPLDALPVNHHSNVKIYLSIIVDHVHLFMTTIYPSSNNDFQYDNNVPLLPFQSPGLNVVE